jgi:hypothetical protein
MEEEYRLEEERGQEWRANRKRRNKDARATSHARLHARWDAELGVRAAAHTREIALLMRDAKGHLRAAEAEHALSNVARSDRRRAATKDTTAGKKHVGGAVPSS